MIKNIIYTLIIFGLLSAGAFYFFVYVPQTKVADEPAVLQASDNIYERPEFDKTQHSIDDENSIWLIVNKQRPIDLNYVPENLVKVEVDKNRSKSEEELMMRHDAAKALESLFAVAIRNDLPLMLGSGYRNSSLQEMYYSNYVSAYGQEEADMFSAKPGTSEHQTGLTADVSPIDRECYLEECFGGTPEGQWLEKNAHEYGFIIRYPKGKEDITGYQYEPWHLRFVGKNLAKEMNKTNETMEEFFGL